jgi:hypothetical protein
VLEKHLRGLISLENDKANQILKLLGKNKEK